MNKPKVGSVFTDFTVGCPFLDFGYIILYTALPSKFIACSRSAFSLKCIAARYSLER